VGRVVGVDARPACRVAKSSDSPDMDATHDRIDALAPDVAARIRGYAPSCLDPGSWSRIAGSARDLIARSAPETPKVAQNRLGALCRLAASVPESQRQDFDFLFSVPVRASYEATCGLAPRTLLQHRGMLDLLSSVHDGPYCQSRKRGRSESGGVDEVALLAVLDEPGVLECVVRLLVAGLGVGRAHLEAARCRFEHDIEGPVVLRPTGSRRPVTGPVRRWAEQLEAGVLLTGADRSVAIEWLTAHGYAVPAARAMSAVWLLRVIGEVAPAMSTIKRHAFSRRDLDRSTKLVSHGQEEPADRTYLRG